MQALYQADLAGIEVEQALENIFTAEEFIDGTKDFARELAKGSWSKKDEVDQEISRFSKDWALDRIGSVDRNILRLSIFELKLDQTPRSVVIDEAIELAKKYSSREAAKFINGILGAYVRKRNLD